MKRYSVLASLIFLLSFRLVSAQNNWVKIPFDTTLNLYNINFFDANTGYVMTENQSFNYKIFKTINGGNNWIPIMDSITGYKFLNASTGFAYILDYNLLKTTLRRTIDGGLTWEQPQIFDFCFARMCMSNDNYIFYGGNYGYMKRSSNFGLNWNYIYHNQLHEGYVSNINFYNKDTGIVHIVFGAVSKTTNGGINWTVAANNNIGDVRYSKYLNRDTIFLAGTKQSSGETPVFFRTTNGGTTYTYVTIPYENFMVKSAYTFNYNRSFVVGNIKKQNSFQGCILETTNTGNIWNKFIPDSNCAVNSISFSNELTGYIAGSKGLLYKTINGGSITKILNNHNILIQNFSLSQNYPNPFNPSTKINYELPITNYVSIKVYDVLGNEIETLVNEKQNAGSYSVDFNAASLPSGIYFYKLVTEKFSETKKMILVK